MPRPRRSSRAQYRQKEPTRVRHDIFTRRRHCRRCHWAICATPGDANVDARVDADDYTVLDRSFAMQFARAVWTDADFD